MVLIFPCSCLPRGSFVGPPADLGPRGTPVASDLLPPPPPEIVVPLTAAADSANLSDSKHAAMQIIFERRKPAITLFGKCAFCAG